ncbi:MAG: phosphoribosylformylglycinamidine synthase subunit PurS [SAR202 cluster bacterium]|nr:phosphoribosylformylglycinamidine synthase subunit PurS [SAR202 cluster bacterium]
MQFNARVHVMLKPAVNDPQGNTVMSGLKSLGFAGVRSVRVGKFLTLQLDAADQAAAERQVDDMCKKLLANPVIETYSVEVSAV